VEEFRLLLAAMKAADPNIIPYGASSVMNIHGLISNYLTPGITGLLGGYGTLETPGVGLKDGQAVYIPYEAGFKEAVEFARWMWAEGMIEPEVFSLDTPTFTSRAKEGRYGIIAASCTTFDVNTIRGKGTALKPLTSPTNPTPVIDYEKPCWVSAGLISDTCKDPEAVARYLDMFYAVGDPSPDLVSANLLLRGKYGTHWEYTDDSREFWTFKVYDGYTGDTEIPAWVNLLKDWGPGMWLPGYLVARDYQVGAPLFEQKQQTTAQLQLPYRATHYPHAYVRFTVEEQESVKTKITDLNLYVADQVAKFVTGATNMEGDWETFLQTCETIGVPDILRVYQAGWARWDAAS
jgi:putative aldouronate transport system substrate-binding protein